MSKSEMKHLASEVGKVIAKRRTACDLTQEQVAERLGIGVEAVSRIERGVVLPTILRLGELADIFECNIADLVTESSSRVTDQTNHITRLLGRLGNTDRAMVLEFVETLSARLGRQKNS